MGEKDHDFQLEFSLQYNWRRLSQRAWNRMSDYIVNPFTDMRCLFLCLVSSRMKTCHFWPTQNFRKKSALYCQNSQGWVVRFNTGVEKRIRAVWDLSSQQTWQISGFLIPWWCLCWIPVKHKIWKKFGCCKAISVSPTTGNVGWRFVIISWWKIRHLWCSWQANLMTSAPAAGESNKDMEAVGALNNADGCSVI